ncbi:MAG: hypothetical protein GY841_16600, partial [FCB group bacterium]|nr:hypothetical protein [FCB group bacterium]
DHQYQPVVLDYGDLPQGPYPTTLSQDGARHIILSANNPTLGSAVDDEIDGQPSAAADDDDSNGDTPDDEDGVRLDSPLIAGYVSTLTITATNAVPGAVLNAWFDFNGDGDFEDAGEQVFVDHTLSEGANVVTISVPLIVLSDTLNARFRYGTDSGLDVTGEASDGEIEDHQYQPVVLDYGDLPQGPYPTTLSQDGARHIILSANNPTLGSAVDD